LIDVIDARSLSYEEQMAALKYLADNLRQADIDEVEASSGYPPLDALSTSLALSEKAFFVFDSEGSPAAVFGVSPHACPGIGIVWMLGTESIRKEAFGIARQTKPYLDEIGKDYIVLWNNVHAANTVSRRWLRWSGFIEQGPANNPDFIVFSKKVTNIV
jgi:hypothetical protein